MSRVKASMNMDMRMCGRCWTCAAPVPLRAPFEKSAAANSMAACLMPGGSVGASRFFMP